jgi:hypothetical protein
MSKFSIFIIIVFFTNNSFSQTNCLKIINDDVTASTKIISQEIDLGDFTVCVLAGITRGTYPKLIFKLKKEACVDDYNSIYFLFQNDERYTGGNYVFSFNCNGYSGQIINNSKLSNLLKAEELKTIRLDAKSAFFQVDLTKEQSSLLKNYINCALDWKSYKDHIKYKLQGKY